MVFGLHRTGASAFLERSIRSFSPLGRSLPVARSFVEIVNLKMPPFKKGPRIDTASLAPLEGALAGLWASVLHLPEVARDDNFFLIGGDLLQGTQLCAQVKALFGVDLPIESLFAEAGTVAGMAAMMEAIRGKEAVGGANREDVADAAAGTIPRRQSQGPAVLTHTEWRSWFLSKFDPHNPAYNESRAYRLKGPLDVALLSASLQTLIQRHEILRTIFVAVDGDPRQVVQDQGVLDFRIQDLSAQPPATQRESLASLFNAVSLEPFDIEKGPLLRFCLVRLANDEYVFLRVWQHIIGDGWSAGIFDRELSAIYSALASGREADLPPLPLQYADYAVWQREWLSGERLDRQVRYWKEKLANLPALRLPIDRKRPAIQSYRGATLDLTLPRELADAVKALGLAEGTTPFMTLFAAYAVLLHRYSGDEDIAVGTPIAGRQRAELEGLIGFFANTLMLRSNLAGEPTFRELLARTRETALAAYENQDVPFDKLVEELAPARDLSRNPLFQVCFALQNMPGAPPSFRGLQARRMAMAAKHAKFDLTLTLRDTPEGLSASWEYCTDLFDPATVERMASNFRVLLESIVVNPDQRIGRLPLLNAAERQLLEVDWNATATEYPRESCIHALFEAQAARTPEAAAALHAQTALTYAELNARANRLANYLRANGVEPGDLVAICTDRSPDLLVGLLGILKAGGAYVPLDPELPGERLAFMLEDAGAKIVLTQKSLLARLPETSSHKLCLDEDWPQIASHSPSNPVASTTPRQLAYVMYTSGSTGQPKGACITHRGVVNYLTWAIQAYRVDSAPAIPVTSSIAFDLTVTALFAPLLAGKAVHFPDAKQVSQALGHTLLNSGIDYCLLMLVPAHLPLLEREVGQHPQSLAHALIVGGEQLYGESLAFWRKHAPATAIWNEYGPTETTVACCVYRVTGDTPSEGPIPFGRPIANTRIYLLDRYGEAVPVGAAGEVYVAGDGVGLGYWRRPELTAERFVPDRFSQQPGALMYRTGDLARYLPDGNLLFLGRLDTQVKVRGFRIELEEIEAAIAEHPGVAQAAVLVREDSANSKSLLAYIVSAGDRCPSFEQLRDLLRKRLPEHMLPSALVVLEKFPLTPNGKIDRRALANTAGRELHATREYAAPRDETERSMCKLWAEVLAVERVGLDDNFFEMGGHSLLAARLFAKLDEQFGRTVPLGALFAAPTVRALAELYRAPHEAGGPSALVAINASGSRPPLFAVGGIMGNVLGFADLSRQLGPDQPFYGLQSVGLDGKQAPFDTIEAMATQYLNDIRTVQPHGPYHLLGVCFGGVVAYEIARQALAAGESVAFLGLVDPTQLVGSKADESFLLRWRPLKRSLAIGSFLRERLRIYASEMRGLGVRGRVKYLASKSRVLPRLIEKRDQSGGVERELNQIEVYRANVLALDRYRGETLNGRLPAIEVFQSARRGKRNQVSHFNRLWEGNCRRHSVPGKDSGDVLKGENVRLLAEILAGRLRAPQE